MAASWLKIDPQSPFSLANIPFGIITTSENEIPRPAIAIGDYVLDLQAFSAAGGFSKLAALQDKLAVFSEASLNSFAALGQAFHRQTRKYLQEVFQLETPYPELLKDNLETREKALFQLASVKNHVPLVIGDYTDFYAGLNHAFNVGVLFRGADNALQPNYKHLPVGYHGRSSSIVVSGQPVRRPCGQILLDPVNNKNTPSFSACRKLDYELELAAFVCKGNTQGQPIPIDKAEEYIFGLVLMNDWSARDIQAWEYVPLGPFNSKNFATTISPWVVLMDALEPFRTTGLEAGDRESLLPYLREPRSDNAFDMQLEIELKSSNHTTSISKTNAKNLLFSFPQMLAHHSVTGCNMRTGDLLGSGTISGTDTTSLGSLLEATRNGKEAVKLADGSERMFLQDDDEVIMRGYCGSPGEYVGFGDCTGKVVPALQL